MNPNGSVRCPREKKCRVLRPRSTRFHPAAWDSAAPQSPTFSLSRPARVDASDRLQSLAWRRDLEGGFVQKRRKHRGPPACRLARRPRAAQRPPAGKVRRSGGTHSPGPRDRPSIHHLHPSDAGCASAGAWGVAARRPARALRGSAAGWMPGPVLPPPFPAVAAGHEADHTARRPRHEQIGPEP